jgi:sugar lactone lactonase YvrE
MKLLTMVPAANTLGEGPLWNERDGKLWWTDIEESRLLRLTPANGAVETIETPERLCSFAFLPEFGSRILGAFETGIAYFDIETNSVDWIARIEKKGSGRRFNDGRTDLQGRFWVGSMVEDAEIAGEDTGALFCLDRSAELVPHAVGVAISNSLCTSPDGLILYFADTPKQVIFAYDLDPEAGSIANKRFFAEVTEGYPDGAVVDAEGCLWSARWGGGEVVRHAPDGKVVERVKIPAGQVTSVAFGGPDRKTLFVTSARAGLDASELARDPGAGNLFIFESDVAGLPVVPFMPPDK